MIRKTKTGLYQIDFRDQHGRRFRKSFERFKDAERALREIRDQVDERSFVPPREIPTFRAVADEWLRAQVKGHDPSTVGGWHTHLNAHLYPLIGDRRLDRIDVHVVERDVRDKLLAKDGIGPKTTNKILTTGSSVMKMAVRHRRAKMNPFAAAERAKLETDEDAPVGDADVYTPEETRLLAAGAQPGIARAFVTLVSRTGARMSEALALRWDEVDLDARTTTIRKAVSRQKLPAELADGAVQASFRLKGTKRKASVRVIPLTPQTVLELKRWRLACPPTSEGWVFPATDGEPARKSTALMSWFYPAVAKAGVQRLNVKALRHSYASALINEGRPVTEVQYLMGHATPVTTLNVYSHFFKARDTRKVADVVASIFDGAETTPEGSGHSVDTAKAATDQASS